MTTDNPALEPVEDKFYGAPETSELAKPTEETVVVKEEIQAPTAKAENINAPVEITEETVATDDEETTQFLELDGEEHSLDDVRVWQKGHMMQSDYTKKTQTLADDRKTFETERDSDRENLLQAQSKASEMQDMLQVLVAEDEEINWAELKDDDPDRYIELKEKADKRREALEKVQASRQTPADDPVLIAEEQGLLFAAHPDWLDEDRKPTEAYTEDTKLISIYASKAGFPPEEFKTMTRARHLITLLKAAKYDALQEKGREIKATRETVPLVTKPKATASKVEPKSMAEVFYGPEAG